MKHEGGSAKRSQNMRGPGFSPAGGLGAARRALQRGQAAGYYRWVLAAQVGAMGDRPVDGAITPPRENERPFYRARNYARLGDADNAIKCLEQSYKEHDGLMVLLKAFEWFDPLSSDPRFQDLVRRVGFP
jgi:hypothetical protein